ncbi:response regulator transcription factor [Kordia jejudonensis]|uniref:response regulator transcription factor n=1 Tax=Kordia jejudonensis TaxID=1348245 RepID=UPI0006293F2B|nr:response regulator transcription factor [Kordia jejudonensis]
MKKIKVLLAEDDYDFGSILKQYLAIHDFDVVWAKDGDEALHVFSATKHQENSFDICVFDVMMPKLDGFSLAEKVIEIDPEIPFIFLTAKKMKEDKIRGLQLGADDYIVKPFEADILVLRLQNILKRTQKVSISSKNEQHCTIGKYVFDAVNYQLKFNGETQRITEKEAQLIQYFYDNKNQLIKREDVLENVWGNDDFFSGRSMDVFISRLRKYFKKDANIAIESTRGVGLTFKIIKN